MILQHQLTRQFDIIPTAILPSKIKIIGAGAVGSFTALFLAKMGFTDIEIWDDDVVDVHNIANQFYRQKDIGKPKVEALQEIVQEFTGVSLVVNNYKWAGDKLFAKVVISAADSMAVRKDLFEMCRDRGLVSLFIDSRMGAENINLYGVRFAEDKKMVAAYPKSLFTDDEANQVPCTAKATMYTVGLIAGMVSKMVKDYLTGHEMAFTAICNVKENDYGFGIG